MKSQKEATCDWCNAELGCAEGSASDLRYWRLRDAGLRPCNTCLLEKYAGPGESDNLFRARLRANRGVSVRAILDLCERAHGVVHPDHIALVRQSIAEAEQRHRAGETVAALDAGQTAWEQTNHLFQVIKNADDVLRGRRAQRQRRNAGFSSGEERKAERQPEWDKWQHAINELHAVNPLLRKSPAQKRVAERFGVSRTSIDKRTNWPGES